MSRARTIDGLQFARDRGTVAGMLHLADLPRLAESGCSKASVAYEIAGGVNAKGRPSLRVSAQGDLALQCQRCLEPMPFAVSVESELELAEDEAQIDAADDDVDRVVVGRAMDVAGLVEDEVILDLPMAPAHLQCNAAAQAAAEQARRTPFAALAGLRKGGAGHG
jgi:uncharacterized protein